MPSVLGQGTQHNCPGKKMPIGSRTASQCRHDDRTGHCKKHQVVCVEHEDVHLWNEECNGCRGDRMAQERREAKAKAAREKKEAKEKKEAWFKDDSKDRKPRKPDEPGQV